MMTQLAEPTAGIFLTTSELQRRWKCSRAKIERRKSEGILKPVRFSSRNIRFRLRHVQEIEAAAECARRY